MEEELRRDLGMDEGESFDSERVKELLQDRALRNAEEVLQSQDSDASNNVEERKS